MGIRRTIQGMLLALGAPLGWLALNWVLDGADPAIAIDASELPSGNVYWG